MTDGAAELGAAALEATALGGAALGTTALGVALGMMTTAVLLGTTTGVATATGEVWVLPGQLVFSGAQDVMVTTSVS